MYASYMSGVAYIPYSQFRRCIRSSRTWIYLAVWPCSCCLLLAEVLIWFYLCDRACVDASIFVLANKEAWRLFYQVRLLLLPPGRIRFGTCYWEVVGARRAYVLESDKSGVAGFGRWWWHLSHSFKFESWALFAVSSAECVMCWQVTALTQLSISRVY